jgi:hypothetical protein
MSIQKHDFVNLEILFDNWNHQINNTVTVAYVCTHRLKATPASNRIE